MSRILKSAPIIAVAAFLNACGGAQDSTEVTNDMVVSSTVKYGPQVSCVMKRFEAVSFNLSPDVVAHRMQDQPHHDVKISFRPQNSEEVFPRGSIDMRYSPNLLMTLTVKKSRDDAPLTELFLDLSNLPEGSEGSAVHNINSAYAKNPAGLGINLKALSRAVKACPNKSYVATLASAAFLASTQASATPTIPKAAVIIPDSDMLWSLTQPAQKPKAEPVDPLLQCFRDQAGSVFAILTPDDIESALAGGQSITLKINDDPMQSDHLFTINMNGENMTASIESSNTLDGFEEKNKSIIEMDGLMEKQYISFTASEAVQAAKTCVKGFNPAP